MIALLFLLLASGMGLMLYWYTNRKRLRLRDESEEMWERVVSATSLADDIESLKAQVDQTPPTRSITKLGRRMASMRIMQSAEGRDFLEWLDEKMVHAGRPLNFGGTEALAAMVLLLTGSIGGVFFLQSSGAPIWMTAGIFIAAFISPFIRVRALVKARQQQARLELPSFINDLSMNLSSGVTTIDDALRRTIHTDDGQLNGRILVVEFARAHAEYRHGARDREDALRAVGERLGVPTVTSFIDALIEGLRTGTPLKSTLVSQSRLAQELFRQDMRAYIGEKETSFVIGLAAIVISLMLILAGPMLMQILGLFSGGGG